MSIVQPLKSETHRVRVTVGDYGTEHNKETVSSLATLTTMKFHLNSTISTADARHATLDIKDFHCGTRVERKYYERAQTLL